MLPPPEPPDVIIPAPAVVSVPVTSIVISGATTPAVSVATIVVSRVTSVAPSAGEIPTREPVQSASVSVSESASVSVSVSVSPSETAAGKLARTLEGRAANCAADWLRDNPGSSASWDDYGTVEAGDSAHVYGVHTAPPQSEHGVSLFAVVRKGAKVTVVRWAQMGTLEHAPVDAFRTTVTKAAARL